jgi:hypothetical protein
MAGCLWNRHSKILTNTGFRVKQGFLQQAPVVHTEGAQAEDGGTFFPPISENPAKERIRLKITILSILFPQLRQRVMGIPPSFVKIVTSTIVPWHLGHFIGSSRNVYCECNRPKPSLLLSEG